MPLPVEGKGPINPGKINRPRPAEPGTSIEIFDRQAEALRMTTRVLMGIEAYGEAHQGKKGVTVDKNLEGAFLHDTGEETKHPVTAVTFIRSSYTYVAGETDEVMGYFKFGELRSGDYEAEMRSKRNRKLPLDGEPGKTHDKVARLFLPIPGDDATAHSSQEPGRRDASQPENNH